MKRELACQVDKDSSLGIIHLDETFRNVSLGQSTLFNNNSDDIKEQMDYMASIKSKHIQKQH